LEVGGVDIDKSIFWVYNERVEVEGENRIVGKVALCKQKTVPVGGVVFCSFQEVFSGGVGLRIVFKTSTRTGGWTHERRSLLGGCPKGIERGDGSFELESCLEQASRFS